MKEQIYIGIRGKVAAINTKDGSIVWEVKFKSSVGAEVSLIEKEEALYVGCYGKLYCINKQTGDILWQNELKGWGFGNIGLASEGVSVQFKTQYVGT